MSDRRRILFISQRRLYPVRSRCLRYEFEDLVQAVDGADIVAPKHPATSSHSVGRLARLLDTVLPRAATILTPDLPGIPGGYEAVVVAVESTSDLASLPPISWLRRKAKVAVCYVEDLFKVGVRKRTGEIRMLRQFDQIYLSCEGTVEELADATGRPCRFMAPSVDALALCPYPHPPRRVIDLYAMGRRFVETHEALLRLAAERGWWYLFDTVGNAEISDHREHRRHLGELIQRTRYFLVNPGKSNAPEETAGQQEIGFRYFEGAAAGAVLFGKAPRTPAFAELFAWPDSLIEMPDASPDVAACLEPLEADPARVERIRRNNVMQCLLRHDHVYRWAEILAALGLPSTPAIEERIGLLQTRAGLVAQGATAEEPSANEAPHARPAM